jgi:hypothetical protein
VGSAKTRYIKRHYKEVKVRRELWEELRRLASEIGLSIPELIELMYKIYVVKRGSPAILIHKTMTTNGEVAYVITVDGTSITLTYKELRALCKSGLVDVSLCLKTILA